MRRVELLNLFSGHNDMLLKEPREKKEITYEVVTVPGQKERITTFPMLITS